ncbi:MAG: AAA family ATPase [Polyangia bacterium]
MLSLDPPGNRSCRAAPQFTGTSRRFQKVWGAFSDGRDAQPSNVLVVAGEGGAPQVKVLDFGLALVGYGQKRQRAEVAGTLGYIAPEVLLGGPPSEASDLYAVGVIACQLLTGRDPFEAEDDDQLLHRVIEREPSRERLAPLGALGDVVLRLLARAPEARFPSASAVLCALAEATGVPLGTEAVAVRESFLQSAPLVGRESDWVAAQSHLEALLAGRGGCLLIAGESGVGKSRFLDELRTHALVRGLQVVRGQAISSGGGAYHALRDALPLLCLSANLDDEAAAVLKALVPELPQLLERAVPDAPLVDAEATRLRLLRTFEALLVRQGTPTALLLEDLQWADGESLALVQRALAVSQGRPLLIVGTVRNDERPQLAEELAGCAVLRLQRLPSEDVAELCRSMLGTPPPQALVALVTSETEGNVFFVVEVMRALAEEAGSLAAVGQGALPNHVLTGGIRAVLQRRLDRVPEPARPLLLLAAVAGRQIDAAMLRAVEPRLDEWLQTCADAAVLEVSEQRWRFAHDKLREALLRELEPEQRRGLHLRVARALEEAYPEAGARAAELAYHFGEAGEARAAARYGTIAGEQALRQGALAEAAALLQQATARMTADTAAIEWARAHRLYGQALFGLGRMQDCAQTCEKVMARFSTGPLHAPRLGRRSALLELVARHALHQVWHLPLPEPAGDAERELLGEVLHTTVLAGEIYAYLGRALDLLQCILGGMELARALSDPHRAALTTAVAAFLLSLTPLRALAPRYLAQAGALAEASTDRHAAAQYFRIGGLVHLFAARWPQSDEFLSRAAVLWRALGNDLMQMFSLGQVATVCTLIGDLERAQQTLDSIGHIATVSRQHRYFLWYQARLCMLALRRGADARAWAEQRAKLTEIDGVLQGTQDRIIQAAVKCGLITAAVRTHDLAAARRCALDALALTPAAVTGYNYAECVFESMNALLCVREQRAESAAGAVTEEQLESALRRLRLYARGLYIGRPQAHVLESRLAALRGLDVAALRHAQQGLELARRLGMPYEEALAHRQLARLLEAAPRSPAGTPPRAAAHREAARALFLRLRDHWYVQALQADARGAAG